MMAEEALRDLTSLRANVFGPQTGAQKPSPQIAQQELTSRIQRGQRAEEALPELGQMESAATEQKIRAQQAMRMGVAQEQLKQEQGFAGQEATAMQARQAGVMEEPEFKPSKMELDDYRNLAGMLIGIGTLVGGKGKMGAMYSLQALNGMMKGFAEGKRDLFKTEQIEFDKTLKSVDAHNKRIEREFNDAMSIINTDRKTALAKLKVLEAELGDGVLAADLRLNDLGKFRKDLESAIKSSDEASKILEQARQKELDRDAAAERRKADAELRRELANIRAQGGGKANQQMFIAQKAVTALRGAASTMESVMKLPSGATAGILPNLTTKDGMINFVRNAGGRSLTASETKAVETLFSGLSRYLATIEANGNAVGLVGLSKQMEKLYPVQGDKAQDIALKLADIRRVSTEAIEAIIESGLFPQQMINAAKEQVQRMEKAVPYTTNDVVEAITKGRTTMLEGTTAKVAGGKSYANEAEAQKAFDEGKLKAGERVTIGGKSGIWE